MKRRKLVRNTVRPVILENLESRILLSTSTATLNSTNPYFASTSTYVSLGNSSSAAGFTITGASGTLTLGSVTINGVGGNLNLAPVVLSSSGLATLPTPATLTAIVAAETFTPITEDAAGGGTVTICLSGNITVLPAGLYIPGGLGNPTLGTPFTRTPTGTVELLDGSAVIASATLNNQQAVFAPTLTAGTHQLTARYLGDSVYPVETSPAVTQAVLGIPTALQLTAPSASLTLGSTMTLSVAAAAQDGSSLNGKIVTLYDGTTTAGTATISNGAASFNWNPTTTADHALYVALGYDPLYAMSTSAQVHVTVNQSAIALALTVSQNSGALKFTASASGPDSLAAAPTGIIQFYDGSALVGSVALGQNANTTFTFAPGVHHFSATYAGDQNFLGATATFNATVSTPLVTPPGLVATAPAIDGTGVANRYTATGHADVITSTHVAGWAIDQDVPKTALLIEIYVDGAAVTQTRAALNRPGLTALYGAANHGFDVVLPGLSQGLHRIDVVALDFSDTPVVLASKTVSTLNTPIGTLDSANFSTIAGWAYSSDAGADPIEIRYRIDQNPAFVALANVPRPDLLSMLGSSDHGFVINLPALPAGQHQITVEAYDPVTGAAQQLAAPSGTVVRHYGDELPTGAVDIASNTRVAGWALAPTALTAPIQVRIDIDGVEGITYPVNIARPDVAAQYGAPNAGFDVALPTLAAGNHRIDVYAIDPVTHVAVFIAGKETVTAAPTAALDIFSPTRIAGWAYAAATPTAPLEIRVDVDGMMGAPVSANLARPDLAFLGATTLGFDVPLTNLAAGTHKITVSLIDPVTGNADLIAARTLVAS